MGTSLIRCQRRGHLTSLDGGGRCEVIEYLLEQARAGLRREVEERSSQVRWEGGRQAGVREEGAARAKVGGEILLAMGETQTAAAGLREAGIKPSS